MKFSLIDIRNRFVTFDAAVWTSVFLAVIVGAVFLVWRVKGTQIIVRNDRPQEVIGSANGPLLGLPCSDPTRRPIAVMLASDPEARPLSGLGAADMVFEMPVTPDGITRLMAVFQCNDPEEVGSIRSARGPFVPLVQGLQALYAHWGGERDVLDALNGGIVDNVDALKYEGSTFYRKQGIPRPHNGFTTLELVRERADNLGYTASLSLTPYLRSSADPERNLAALVSDIEVPWPGRSAVRFEYDEDTNSYLRWRDDTPEIDALTGDQVRVAVVIQMESEAEFLYDQYIDIRMTGEGDATLWQNGRKQTVRWKKERPSAMLTFVNSNGITVPLAPGPIWIMIDAPLSQL